MKSYDKASWHIDGGEKESEVVSRFKKVFMFLKEKNMLTEDGVETLEYCMDSSVSLNSTMVTEEGKKFLDSYYDNVLAQDPSMIRENLMAAYKDYMNRVR